MIGTLLPIAAAVNALLLASALAYRSWRKRAPAGLYGSAFLGGAAAAVALIALDHAGVIPNERMGAFAEGVLTLASGPLFVLFIAALVGVRTQAHWGFALVAVFAAASIGAPAIAADAFLVERLVVVQMGFTAWAAVLALRRTPSGRRAANARALALAAIAAVGVLHFAQALRMAFSDVEAIVNIVPLAGAAAFLAATAAVYFGGRITALDPLTDAHRIAGEAERALVARLDGALHDGLMRDAKLTLAQAAAALQEQAQEITRALAAVHGKSFAEYVQAMRIEDARRLLSDPSEARTSMEAIGLLVGFGSRSAFYKAFSDHVGVSPAAYRENYARNPVQKA